LAYLFLYPSLSSFFSFSSFSGLYSCFGLFDLPILSSPSPSSLLFSSSFLLFTLEKSNNPPLNKLLLLGLDSIFPNKLPPVFPKRLPPVELPNKDVGALLGLSRSPNSPPLKPVSLLLNKLFLG
jgi:hypothetical protein